MKRCAFKVVTPDGEAMFPTRKPALACAFAAGSGWQLLVSTSKTSRGPWRIIAEG